MNETERERERERGRERGLTRRSARRGPCSWSRRFRSGCHASWDAQLRRSSTFSARLAAPASSTSLSKSVFQRRRGWLYILVILVRQIYQPAKRQNRLILFYFVWVYRDLNIGRYWYRQSSGGKKKIKERRETRTRRRGKTLTNTFMEDS